MKEITKLGSIIGNHQSGLVLSRGGQSQQNTPYSTKTLIRPSDILVLGGAGRNERQDRDSKRVLDRRGCMFSLKAHIALEPPLVVRRLGYGDVERY
jgi:hypothetical protein